jgi:site-specific recombinase XerD
VIQKYLGHAQLETTMIYLHLTQKGQEDAFSIINDLMKGFNHECH